ncbi:hypothetical protein BDV33DRAFT_211035 [Aspergillus novoparasiticus]|uniref:Uncharacterized protein n=1 Tax=Aspergillus novoparasiticus TaxID=986946 RepID=A0A5N6E547_9EURO|nr:hypothetical protein BDV33DRAFT_211035 [Aspergillus novoparasiticus]
MAPATKLRAWMGASDGMFMMECMVLWALMAAHITIFLWPTTRWKREKYNKEHMFFGLQVKAGRTD